MKHPNLQNFMRNVVSIHGNCRAFSLTNAIGSDRSQNIENGFIIRHFAHSVVYATVNISLNNNKTTIKTALNVFF